MSGGGTGGRGPSIAPAALLALCAGLALAGCDAAHAPEPAPTPSATATVSTPRNLVAADFDTSALGARIEGPDGFEVESEVTIDGRRAGTVTSYVACPSGMDPCDPANAADGTIYTYVHRVTRLTQEDAAAAQDTGTAGATPTARPVESGATMFATTGRATGFNGSIGYSYGEAERALGVPGAINTSTDGGTLIWRVTQGSGWKPGETITFFWQSTVPPAKPARDFRLTLDGESGPARGPFPPDTPPVSESATPAG